MAVTAKKLDEPGAALRQFLRGVHAPRQINPDSVSNAPEVRRFKIKEVAQDHLQCVYWDGVKEGLPAYVAKPWVLRASTTSRTFSGGQINYSNISATGDERTATLGAESETQVVVPEYVVGDEIVGVRNVRGKTGVTRTADGVEKDVEWLDMNTDGRAWAKQA